MGLAVMRMFLFSFCMVWSYFVCGDFGCHDQIELVLVGFALWYGGYPGLGSATWFYLCKIIRCYQPFASYAGSIIQRLWCVLINLPSGAGDQPGTGVLAYDDTIL